MQSGGPAAVPSALPAEGWRRAALWVMVLGLPLAYELSGHLAGPRAYYGGNQAFWFAGLQVKLVLMAVGAGALALGLRRADGGLAALGWPARPRLWQLGGLAGLVALALALALFYHPGPVSSDVYRVTASTPADLVERLSLVGVALADALVQESVWRGAIISWLRPHFGAMLPVALSVASFVLFHPALGWRWGRVLILLLLTLTYTALVLWRKSLLPAVYLHFILSAGQLLAPVAR